jgi:hypothetical protein
VKRRSGVLKVGLDTLRCWLFCIDLAQEGWHKTEVYFLGMSEIESEPAVALI